MSSILNFISYTGIYCIPIVMYVVRAYCDYMIPEAMENEKLNICVWIFSFMIGGLVSLDIFSRNATAKANGKTRFCIPNGMAIFGGCNTPEYTSTRYKYLYPQVPKHLLHKVPVPGSYVLGKHQGQYVCTPSLNLQGKHIFIFGGSGTGKSSTMLLPDLILNLRSGVKKQPSDGYAELSALIIDIKGELSAKSSKKDDPSVLIFDPSDHSTLGYDPFFLLDENSTLEKIYQTMEIIAISLIAIPPKEAGEIWKPKARQLLAGLLTYEYDTGCRSLIDCIDKIHSQPIEDLLNEIKEQSTPDKVYYRTLSSFFGLAAETLGGIETNMSQHIELFTKNSQIQYSLRDNPKKFSPRTLDEEIPYEIFVRVKESELTKYRDILMLILNQTFSYFEDRDFDTATSKRGILTVIDELSRVSSDGPIDRLSDVLRTGRSRGISCILLSQSMEGLTRAYNHDDLIDMLQNCSYVSTLDGSPSIQKYFIGAAGRYQEMSTSRQCSGKAENVSYSYREKDILIPADFSNLKQPSHNEVLVLSKDDGGFFRLKKVPYYSDPFFKQKADDIKKSRT